MISVVTRDNGLFAPQIIAASSWNTFNVVEMVKVVRAGVSKGYLTVPLNFILFRVASNGYLTASPLPRPKIVLTISSQSRQMLAVVMYSASMAASFSGVDISTPLT